MIATLTIRLREQDEERAAERAWEIARKLQSDNEDVIVAGVERVDA